MKLNERTFRIPVHEMHPNPSSESLDYGGQLVSCQFSRLLLLLHVTCFAVCGGGDKRSPASLSQMQTNICEVFTTMEKIKRSWQLADWLEKILKTTRLDNIVDNPISHLRLFITESS